MHSLLSKIRNNQNPPFVLVLLVISVIIGIANFPFGKWLLGWDNLVPELNFGANFARGFFSLWQENEGLGLTGGHGFATTLIHTTLLYLMSFVFPTEALRPLFHLLMYVTGGLGAYFLFVHLFRAYDAIQIRFAGLLSGICYLLNFATIQIFYIPLEAFSAHYAALPWLLLYFLKLIYSPSKRNIIVFFLISFLSSIQGFIPPLFVVYALFLAIAGIVGLVRFWQKKSEFIKRYIIAGIITLIANAYWLLPIGYYTLVNSQVYLNAYNNITQTNEFILKNQEFGNFTDMIFMRGFIFESGDVDAVGNPILIFQPWIDHFENPLITFLGIAIFIVIAAGVFWSIRKKSWELKALLGMFIITFIFLSTNVPVLSAVSEFIRNNVPVLKQAFRIPFTKFAVSLSLFYSLFLGLGFISMLELFQRISKKIKMGVASSIALVCFVVLLVFVSLPTFQGNLFYKKIHADFPESYLQLFKFFDDRNPNERIAHFPSPSPTGWSYYKWGYTGSGFLWYGLKQPILDRNFDVWNNYNENFYWEAAQAMYSKNDEQFEDILNKYHVSWVLIDDQLTGTSHPRSLYTSYIIDYLKTSNLYTLETNFDNLSLYKRVEPFSAISAVHSLEEIGPIYEWTSYDKAYQEHDNYVATDSDPSVYYPYRSLFTGRGSKIDQLSITHTSNDIIFSPQDSIATEHLELVLPEITEYEETLLNRNPISISADGSVSIPYAARETVFDEFGREIGAEVICWPAELGEANQQVFDGFIRLNSTDATSCRTIHLPEIEQRIGYLIAVQSRRVEGTPLRMWVENLTSRHPDLELYLHDGTEFTWEYFIVPPMAPDGLGYTIHFDNISIGNKETSNDLAEVIVYPIPYHFMTDLKMISTDLPLEQNNELISISYAQHSLTKYSVQLSEELPENATLVLWQSYHDDWDAYTVDPTNWLEKTFPAVFGAKIPNQVKVNNWANGWEIPPDVSSNKQIKLIFWPQILQYFGLSMILLFPFIVWKFAKK